MSDYSTNSTINLSINGQQVEQKLSKYEKQLVDLRDKAQKAAEIGDRGTLVKTQKEIVKVEQQMRKVRTATANVEHTINNLDKARPTNLKKDLNTLKQQLNGLERGSEAWNAHVEKIKLVQAELKKVNSELKESEGFWDKFNRKMNDWQTTLAAGAAAVTGIIMAGRKAVNAYAEIDAEMANVRKFTGLADEQVKELNKDFKKIDTRTSVVELNKLAEEAGRLGKQSIEDVLGFVKAADVINVALDDLGDGATLTLSKLTNIFGDEKIYGTEQSLLKVGSVINELSQNCTASAPYLAQFAQRLAGVGAQAGLTIPQIMAFAAVLDSQGQAVEMSATAFSKLIMDLFKNPEKIAKATGLSLDELNSKLKKSTNEGLLLLLNRLNELGNMDVLAPIFKDMGEDGARASSVIAALAGNIDTVKWQQEEATKAFEEGISVTNEFNVQNNTVEAGLDKARKSINAIAVELGESLMPVMSHVMSSTTLILKLMNTTINFLKNYTTTIITATASIVAYTVAVNASNIAFKAQYYWLVLTQNAHKVTNALMATGKVITTALSLAYFKLTGNTTAAATAQMALNTAMKANVLVAIAGIVLTAATAIYTYLKRAKEATATAKTLTAEERRLKEQTDKIGPSVDSLQSKFLKLQTQWRNLKNEAEKKKWIQDNKTEFEDLGLKVNKVNEAENILVKNADRVINALKAVAEASAFSDLYEESIKKRAQHQRETGGKVKAAKATNQNLTDEEKNALMQAGYTGKAGKYTEEALKYITNLRIKKAREAAAAVKKEYDDEVNYYGKKMNEANEKAVNARKSLGNASKGPSTIPESENDKSKKDKLKKEKEWKAKELALNRIQYARGEKDYDAYQSRILEIELQYQTLVLKNEDLTNQERLEAQAVFFEAKKKQEDNANKRTLQDINDYYAEIKAVEMQRYAEGKVDSETYNDSLKNIELKRLKDIVYLYKDGSKEHADAQKAYNDALMRDQVQNRQKYEQKQKEHLNKLERIREEAFGGTSRNRAALFNEELQALNQVYKSELNACGDNAEAKLEIEEQYQKAKMLLAEKYGQITVQNGFSQLQEQNAKFMEWLDSDAGKAVTGTYETVISGMSSIFSQLSSMIQADLEAETAAIESRYEKEKSAAEGNNYVINQIEQRKQDELAKTKNEANEKMYNMQVIEAIAQTATAALNAYSSAAAIPVVGHVLAPIAAATATAAGMMQVAAIKKQQAAAAASGYSGGGYTKKGAVDEPAGIVHAGEWVASQRLLANPSAAAIIESLDYAQRTNTIGSITPLQVNRDVSANAHTAVNTATTHSNNNSYLSESLQKLNERLNEPFITVNTVTGDTGIKKAQDDYNKYIKNKTPKSKR